MLDDGGRPHAVAKRSTLGRALRKKFTTEVNEHVLAVKKLVEKGDVAGLKAAFNKRYGLSGRNRVLLGPLLELFLDESGKMRSQLRENLAVYERFARQRSDALFESALVSDLLGSALQKINVLDGKEWRRISRTLYRRYHRRQNYEILTPLGEPSAEQRKKALASIEMVYLENQVREIAERLKIVAFERGVRPATGDRWKYSDRLSEPPDTVHFASHGGGYQYLLDFLGGREPGYPLEYEGLGIQVHPNDYTPKVNDYAEGRAPRRFDDPATLTFFIESQYLDSAPNLYEAGLRTEYVGRMSNLKLTNLRTGEVITARDVTEFRKIVAARKIAGKNEGLQTTGRAKIVAQASSRVRRASVVRRTGEQSHSRDKIVKGAMEVLGSLAEGWPFEIRTVENLHDMVTASMAGLPDTPERLAVKSVVRALMQEGPDRPLPSADQLRSLLQTHAH